jgi:UDP-glucose 4-epimerase
MKILVTGAAGFIASNLIKRLLDAGNEVVAIDNYFLGKKIHIEPYLLNPNFKFIDFDLLNLDGLKRIFTEHFPDRVWHLAANSDISYGEKFTDFDLKGGTLATYNVLESMRLSGCRELIFSSSGAVYGEPTMHPTPENYGPLMPISLYAGSKLACEGLVSSYSHSFGIQAWMFRFGNVIGPNPTHGVIFDFANQLLNDRTHLKILGDGTQTKPYMHVEDCLDGMEFAQMNSRDAINFFNLAAPDQTSVSTIAGWILDEMGILSAECEITFTGGRRGWRGDVPFVNLNTEKMRTLGWIPKLNSDGAIKKAIHEIILQLTNAKNKGNQ